MRTIGRRSSQVLLVGLLAAAVALTGCKTTPPEEGEKKIGEGPPVETGPHAALLKLLPKAGSVGDWKPAAAVKIYAAKVLPGEDVEPLAADVGNDAVIYESYDYAKSATASYNRAQAGEEVTLRVFEMGSPAEAFGIFSVRARGTQSPAIGLAARMGTNTLGMVKGPYFTWIEYKGFSNAPAVLMEFGRHVEGQIRSLGYKPALIETFQPGYIAGEHYYLHTFETLAILPCVREPGRDLARWRAALGLGRHTNVAVVGYETTRLGEINYVFAIGYPTEADALSAERQLSGHLDESACPADKNVAIAVTGKQFRQYLVGTFNAEENSIRGRDRIEPLVVNLGG